MSIVRRSIRYRRTVSCEYSSSERPPQEQPRTADEEKRALRALAVALESGEVAQGRSRELAREVWRGLVSGDWRIMDRFESAERCYLVARLNRGATPSLTPRERQVLSYAQVGHANKVAAYELGLTPSTVATHLKRAMGKLGIDSRAALIRSVPVSEREASTGATVPAPIKPTTSRA